MSEPAHCSARRAVRLSQPSRRAQHESSREPDMEAASVRRDDIHPDALTLYLRNGLLVPLVPAVAFAVSYAAPVPGLALLVGLNLLGLLPLESHRPPAGVDRGPRSTIRPRRSAAR